MNKTRGDRKTRFMNFRTTERRAEKLRLLAQPSGQSVSGVIDVLIDNALIVPAEQVIHLVRVAGLEDRNNPNKHESAVSALVSSDGALVESVR
jgi:hypothetical protein